ncbi:hypothetical protein [Dongia sedimenti]|uniref:Uncharacterized protein n=1 Tax=Dongia sedimenti TaxID=3064282 RepID=A0ABU0YU80_9PROT|nr:hypothetical protein [Rhodospirillaceae bacterium R-7]
MDHYLRADGPLGSGPLRFLDATPAEIALASKIDDLAEDDAQRAFLTQFGAQDVEAWLSGRRSSHASNSEVPGYFRYLVLTCFVSATESGAGVTHNFRVRLGRLLGLPTQMQQVSGVNQLWHNLSDWCDQRRTGGHPIRKIELPPYGNMKLIGHAVRLAFPSWEDRRQLTKLLRRLDAEIRRSPVRLVQELSRPIHAGRLPIGIAAAFIDFATAIRSGGRLLSGHRFWRLVQSIEHGFSPDDGPTSRKKWDLFGYFGGYEQDELHLRLSTGGPREETIWDGSLTELEAQSSNSKVPRTLAVALGRGILVLAEAPGALWKTGSTSLPDSSAFVILSRSASRSKLASLATAWYPLEGDWSVSDRLRRTDLVLLRDVIEIGGDGTARDVLRDIAIEGGIRTGSRVWLGRPGFLPRITTSEQSRVLLQPLDQTGSLTVADQGGSWRLDSAVPVSGRWRVVAREEHGEAEKILTLEADAPERWDFTLDDSLDHEEELTVTSEDDEEDLHSSHPEGDETHPSVSDLMEAIYSAPSGFWSERDLIPLLLASLDSRYIVWDLLRAYAEAGVLEPRLSRSWKARTWHLCPPRVVHAGELFSVVEGAVGSSTLKRLADTSKSIGATLSIRASDTAKLTPPIILVRGVTPSTLSQAIRMPLVMRRFPRAAAAPACWAREPRSEAGRIVADKWSFAHGHFLAAGSGSLEAVHGVSLERLVREKRDDRDLYRISGDGQIFLTSMRTTAILEAYRRSGQPLFRWNGGILTRLARAGYLPIPIARALRLRFLRPCGLTLGEDGSWGYSYRCDIATADVLWRMLGGIIEAPLSQGRENDFLARIVAARRAGRRSDWYVPGRTEVLG